MPELKEVRTSLEVGFKNGELPLRYAGLRGRDWRTIPAVDQFPYEDEQFQVVLMEGTKVTRARVREAHRVLKKNGRFYFTVAEDAKGGAGMTLPKIYQLTREGFNLVGVERTPWWKFWVRDRTLSICAEKKNWKSLVNTYRPYV